MADEQFQNVLRTTLSNLPLFSGCEEKLLIELSRRGQIKEIQKSEELELGDGAPLFVVINGSMQVCVGCGPKSHVGPGAVLNQVGMLGLNQTAEVYRPVHSKVSNLGGGKADLGSRSSPKAQQMENNNNSGGGASSSSSQVQNGQKKDLAQGTDKVRCIHNLCPHAPAQLTADNCGQKLAGWLRLTVAAAGSKNAPAALDTTCVDGATIGVFDPELIKEVLGADYQYKVNFERLVGLWVVILRSFVFPGVPPEVAWSIAEKSVRVDTGATDRLTVEGEVGEAADSIIVIDHGEATVEKLVADDGKAICGVAGDLGPGAIIGDVCFIGIKVPRAASVRAKTAMSSVRIPCREIINVMSLFPGMIACMKGRLRDTALLLQPSLPQRTDALATMRIFSKCGFDFVKEVAGSAERRLFHCGDVVIREGSTEGNLFVIEFGQCSVIKAGVGLLDMACIGTCIGERTFLGLSNSAGASICAATPLALILTISQTMFKNIVMRYPQEDHQIKTGLAKGGNARGGDVAKLKVLQHCGAQFISSVEGGIETRCYMPGQTICVQGAADAGSMFVVKGGRAAVEVKGKVVNEMGPGVAFGELAMLGLVRRRTSTVRAATLCFMFEIPRAAFLAALDQNPEEREHFERLAAKHSVSETSVTWPIFEGAEDRLLYQVNHFAERRIAPAGAWTSRKGEPLERCCAVMVMQGTIQLLNDAGEEIEEICEGHCFNEQMLIGLPNKLGNLVPKTTVEVQIMTMEAFEKIMEDFQDDKEWVQQNVVEEIVRKAERKLGFRQENDVLRFSALFRSVPDSFTSIVRKQLEARLYMPGEVITEEGKEGDCMYLLVDGKAYVDAGEDGKWFDLAPGACFGEALAFGVASRYPTTVRTSSLCSVRALPRKGLQDAMRENPEMPGIKDLKLIFEALQKEKDHKLEDVVRGDSLLSKAGDEFVSMSCRYADDAFFAPGEEIVSRIEPCKLGLSPIYVLLSGQAEVENEFGIVLGSLTVGDICGEGGGLGISNFRNMTVRAWKGGLTYFARLHGMSIKTAVDAFPQRYKQLVATFEHRRMANLDFTQSRRLWLEKAVVPALAACPIFSNFPKEVLCNIAMPLVVTTYAAGEIIREAGESVDSMLVLVEGKIEASTKAGIVGRLSDGATVGEVSVLGLFAVCMVNLRALRQCHVLSIPSLLIRDVLKRPGAESARKCYTQITERRHEQVAGGLPFSSLSLDISHDDIAARIIALHAERMDLAPGGSWLPRSDSGPNGPHFTIIVKGRASIVLGGRFENGPPVMNLLPSSLLPEGLTSKYGARVEAVTHLEAYRVRMCDFLLAEHTAPLSTRWIGQFKKMYTAAKDHMDTRLGSARGVADSKESHMNTHKRGWASSADDRRNEAMMRPGNSAVSLPALVSTGRSMSAGRLTR